MIHQPRFLVVDKPTAGLDPEERLRFRGLVTELGLPILLSSHSSEDIETTCRRVVVVASGRSIFDGSLGELLARVDGALWQLPADAVIPADVISLGTRTTGNGRVRRLLSYRSLPQAEPVAHNLEDAYAACLVDAYEAGVGRAPPGSSSRGLERAPTSAAVAPGEVPC